MLCTRFHDPLSRGLVGSPYRSGRKGSTVVRPRKHPGQPPDHHPREAARAPSRTTESEAHTPDPSPADRAGARAHDAEGLVAPPADAELTLSGYEFYPQALAATIRWAHRAIGKPIYVTESGVATDDDCRRIAFIDQALDGVRACLDEGIPVHSYLYWSLLDNFEWTHGYGVPFGLVAVDRATFRRTLKPSARHLGAIARSNRI